MLRWEDLIIFAETKRERGERKREKEGERERERERERGKIFFLSHCIIKIWINRYNFV